MNQPQYGNQPLVNNQPYGGYGQQGGNVQNQAVIPGQTQGMNLGNVAQGMDMINNTMGGLKQVEGQVQGALDALNKNHYLDFKPEIMGIRVPACADEYYKKIFGRKTPREPYNAICPHCSKPITTQIGANIGFGTVGCAALICFCSPTSVWCPFFVDDCYDHQHVCPQCSEVLQKERFLFG